MPTELAALSWNPVSDFEQLTEFSFMVQALEAGTIVAVMAGAVGWFMVLRRQTFAGHTLSMVAFPGAAGATLVGLPLAFGYFGACAAAALVLAAVSRPAVRLALSLAVLLTKSPGFFCTASAAGRIGSIIGPIEPG